MSTSPKLASGSPKLVVPADRRVHIDAAFEDSLVDLLSGWNQIGRAHV